MDMDDALDMDLNEMDCLKRYYSTHRALARNRVCPPLKSEGLVETDIGRNMQNSIVDWSVSHAMKGDRVICQVRSSLHTVILQASLFLIITVPYYINMRGFSHYDESRSFSFFMGFASFMFISVVMLSLFLDSILQRAYAPIDALITYIEYKPLWKVIQAMDYLGIIALVVAMFIAAFDRNLVDGVVQLWAPLLFLAFIILFLTADGKESRIQDMRIYRFYRKYCNKDGSLRDEYTRAIVLHSHQLSVHSAATDLPPSKI